MADISADFWSWSSTAGNNSPSGSTAVGTGLDDNLRAIQAAIRGAIEPATSVSGTDTITASMAGLGSYVTGMKVWFTPAGTNTGATTININSIGAKSIFAGNTALVGGELHASIPVVIQYDGTQFQLLGPIFKQPTRQVLTSGTSATYTTPTGCTRINVKVIGGGGGGGGGGTSGGTGTAGHASSFGTLTANGGGAGAGSGVAGGAGGSASGGDINIPGTAGDGASNQGGGQPGSRGGNSVLGGGGGGGTGGSNVGGGSSGATNSGGGGGGGGSDASVSNGGSGGGGGGYCEKLITAPSSTYTYTVGGTASGGSAGTNGQGGGAGAAGIIIVDEYYN